MSDILFSPKSVSLNFYLFCAKEGEGGRRREKEGEGGRRREKEDGRRSDQKRMIENFFQRKEKVSGFRFSGHFFPF
jgi:hypothetical protein